jgi:hypothetical protein
VVVSVLLVGNHILSPVEIGTGSVDGLLGSLLRRLPPVAQQNLLHKRQLGVNTIIDSCSARIALLLLLSIVHCLAAIEQVDEVLDFGVLPLLLQVVAHAVHVRVREVELEEEKEHQEREDEQQRDERQSDVRAEKLTVLVVTSRILNLGGDLMKIKHFSETEKKKCQPAYSVIRQIGD